MKGDVFSLFSDGVSKDDISSFYLSYCEQELHPFLTPAVSHGLNSPWEGYLIRYDRKGYLTIR